MKCKKIQDLIMSDYIDGELKGGLLKRVKQHLAGCEQCRQFEQSLQREVVASFREAGEIKPPESVWEGIKEAILGQELERKSVLITVREGLDYLFRIPKPVLTFATIGVIIILTFAFIRRPLTGPKSTEDYFGQDPALLSYLDVDESGYLDFGTAIEEYLM